MIATILTVIIMILSAVLYGMIAPTLDPNDPAATGGPTYMVYTWLIFGFDLWLVVGLTCARGEMRRRHEIPGDCCGDGCLGDCCCAYWCSCCTVIQMHRHTHDEYQHRYVLGSKTGLQHQGLPLYVS